MNIQEDHKGYVHVKGVRTFQVGNEEEALELLFMGENNRTIS